MLTSMEFVLGSVCKEHGLTRAQFDSLSDEAQIDRVAHYLADQQIAKWQNYRDAAQMQQR